MKQINFSAGFVSKKQFLNKLIQFTKETGLENESLLVKLSHFLNQTLCLPGEAVIINYYYYYY